MTAMTSAAAAAARQEPDTSRVSKPVSSVAMAPNHTGTNTHTSFRDMRGCGGTGAERSGAWRRRSGGGGGTATQVRRRSSDGGAAATAAQQRRRRSGVGGAAASPAQRLAAARRSEQHRRTFSPSTVGQNLCLSTFQMSTDVICMPG
jgi:hypothetical protein